MYAYYSTIALQSLFARESRFGIDSPTRPPPNSPAFIPLRHTAIMTLGSRPNSHATSEEPHGHIHRAAVHRPPPRIAGEVRGCQGPVPQRRHPRCPQPHPVPVLRHPLRGSRQVRRRRQQDRRLQDRAWRADSRPQPPRRRQGRAGPDGNRYSLERLHRHRDQVGRAGDRARALRREGPLQQFPAPRPT